MKEIVITRQEAGRRLDRYLDRYLNEASGSFIYRMLRKKNITLNGQKAAGNEKLQTGDVIRIWFSQETLEKFRTGDDPVSAKESGRGFPGPDYPGGAFPVIYEDEHILLANKPAGILSQKAGRDDISMCEYLIGYLLRTRQTTPAQLETVRPSVCNRLDRNTSGLVICGKTIPGLQGMSEMLRERTLKKYYLCFAAVTIRDEMHIRGYLIKNGRSNQVRVLKQEEAGSEKIETRIRSLKQGSIEGRACCMLEVELITGKSHQIRAHLASISHPLLGDPKYGNKEWNDLLKKRFHIKTQMLHSWRTEFPEMDAPLEYLSGRSFEAPLPDSFEKMEKAMEAGAEEKRRDD